MAFRIGSSRMTGINLSPIQLPSYPMAGLAARGPTGGVKTNLAFRCAAGDLHSLERSVRHACRDEFRQRKLLQRIIPDIQRVLDVPPEIVSDFAPDDDPAMPTPLWDPGEEAE